MDQFVFILIAVGVALANYLVKKSREAADDNAPVIKPPTVTVRRPVVRKQEDEDERIRKFMEALGMPAGGAVPRKVIQPVPVTQVIPQKPLRPLRPVRPRILPVPPVVSPPPFPMQEIPPAPVFEATEPESFSGQSALENATSTPAEAPADMMAPIESLVPVEAPVEGSVLPDIRALLRSPGSLKAAFVMREIIGPPRGLHSYN